MKATITLTPANHEYLKRQDGTMSDTINDILQAHRSLGPMLDRMKKQADRLDQIGISHFINQAPWMKGNQK
jgi:hypothetical protein